MLDRLKAWARLIKRDLVALYLAARDPRVPWVAKLMAMATAAYALSPIDLIPDFIPVIGYLDDLIIVPAAIFLTARMIPASVMMDLREQASRRLSRLPGSRAGAAAVVVIWAAFGLLLVRLLEAPVFPSK